MKRRYLYVVSRSAAVVLVSMLLSIVSIQKAWSVKAKPGSGVYGDEYYHYRLDAEGKPLPARTPAESGIRRVPAIDATFPTKGDVRSIVILVEYQDVRFVTPNTNYAFSSMLNEAGYSNNGGTGSARDYFLASSGNMFRPEFDVYGPYRLSHNRSYYTYRAARMIFEACELADEQGGVDFSQYDYNNDGNIDNVFVYYAGYNSAEGGPAESIWPHRSIAAEWSSEKGSYITHSVDNKWIWDYACTSELTGYYGSTQCGIGTFCHEFSHVLGLDDLYNTAESSVYTVGTWDIMSEGNYNNNGRTPPAYSAFERFMVGWMTPEQLSSTADYILEPIETSNKAYLIAPTEHNLNAYSPNPSEYWLVENRQAVGWDAPKGCLPGTGLLISHITFHKGKWDNNTPNNTLPLGYDICEARYKNPTLSTSSDTYPGLFNVTSFIPTNNNGETLLEYQLQNIRTVEDTTIAFHFGKDTGSGLRLRDDALQPITTSMLLDKPTRFDVQQVEIEGAALQDSLLFICINDGHFQLSWDGIHWSNDTLWDKTATDSTYQRTLYVRYYPTLMCSSNNAILFIGTRSKVQSTQAILKGLSVRETLISEVIPKDATEITPYSFTAHWERQNDAELYYLTLYTLTDEPFTENYTIDKTLKITDNTYISSIFPADISQIELRLTHNYAATSIPKQGQIKLEATDEEGLTWDSVGVTVIRSSNQINQTRTFTLDENRHYRRYRLVYSMLQGTGELSLKNILTTTTQRPEYIYSNNEYRLGATITAARFSDLRPATDYYYYLICQENKGCERHTSPQGPIQHVRTLAGTTNTSKQFTVNYSGQTLKAFFPESAKKGHFLYVYELSGQLAGYQAVPEGATSVDLHFANLRKGNMYIAKYISGSDLKRKNLWAKFIY